MKSSLIILLIGAIVAVACAAPSRSLKVSLQDDDGDKLAKAAGWFSVAKKVIGGINHVVNGEKKAMKQMDDDDDDGDDLAFLEQASTEEDDDDDDDLAFLEQMTFSGKKQKASTEEDDDDDDDGDKAAAQFHIHFHFG